MSIWVFLISQFPPAYNKQLDPTQGFNIKTNFPKMENKISKHMTGITF